MIDKLVIKNFQSHKHSVLVFSPRVNAITGTSDVGKTAIIRALKFILQNKPAGDDFISDWANEVSVELLINGTSIERVKVKSNSYIIN